MFVLIIALLAFVLDRLTKMIAVKTISDTAFSIFELLFNKGVFLQATEYLRGETIPVAEGIFHFTYAENTGMAWSMFAGQRLFLILANVLVLGVIIGLLIKYKPKDMLIKTSAGFVIGGAIGNILDRVIYGFVIDFLDFRLINYPVFNIADCFIVVGAVLFAVYVIFFDKEEEKYGSN